MLSRDTIPLVAFRAENREKMGDSPSSGLETFDRVHGATVPSKIVQHMIDLGKER